MLETLQIINLILGLPVAVFILMATFCKPFREWILNKKKEKQIREEEEEDRRETDRCVLRNSIVAIYYRHTKSKIIKEWEYENLSKLYTQYKKIGGNSFVDKIWDEVQSKWAVER